VTGYLHRRPTYLLFLLMVLNCSQDLILYFSIEYVFISRWQQLLINRFVGYDTILINSLLSSPGQGNYLLPGMDKLMYIIVSLKATLNICRPHILLSSI